MPSRDLVLYVQVPKTGSSSIRRLFHAAAAADSATRAASWLCTRNADVRWPCDPDAEVVLGGAWVYGAGDVHRSPSSGGWVRGRQMLTTLREPIARVLSSYAYFVLGCGDHNKFKAVTGCSGNFSFVRWTEQTANHYTRLFSAYQPPGSKHRLGSWIDPLGERRAPDASDVERAFATLSRPSSLVLHLETDIAGPPDAQRAALRRLRAWLDRSGARRAVAALANATRFPHENALAPTYRYVPTATDRRAACERNRWDCALYLRFTNQSCACGDDDDAPQRTFSPGSQGA